MPSTRPSKTRGPSPCFAQHGLFYSTSTGKTEEVADLIQEVRLSITRTRHPRQCCFGNLTGALQHFRTAKVQQTSLKVTCAAACEQIHQNTRYVEGCDEGSCICENCIANYLL